MLKLFIFQLSLGCEIYFTFVMYVFFTTIFLNIYSVVKIWNINICLEYIYFSEFHAVSRTQQRCEPSVKTLLSPLSVDFNIYIGPSTYYLFK